MPSLARLTANGNQMYPDPYAQQVKVSGKHKKGKKPKGRSMFGEVRDPVTGAMADRADPNMGASAVNPPAPTTTTPLSQTVASVPGMSSYEKRRKSILDIMNDPALAAYNESYTPNYDIARSQVENAFAQAMGEVQSRQAMGEGLLASMPAGINQAYDGARASIEANNAATQQAQANSGVASYMVPGADTAPVTNALQMEQAGAISQMPALGVGLANLVSQQRQQLSTDRGSSLADIAMQEESAKRQAANDGPSWLQQQLIQQELADEEAKQSKKKNSTVWGEDYIGQDRGGDVAKNFPKLTERLRSGTGTGKSQEAYSFVRSELNKLSGLGPKKQQARLAKIMSEARKKYPGATRAISLAMFEVMG